MELRLRAGTTDISGYLVAGSMELDVGVNTTSPLRYQLSTGVLVFQLVEHTLIASTLPAVVQRGNWVNLAMRAEGSTGAWTQLYAGQITRLSARRDIQERATTYECKAVGRLAQVIGYADTTVTPTGSPTVIISEALEAAGVDAANFSMDSLSGTYALHPSASERGYVRDVIEAATISAPGYLYEERDANLRFRSLASRSAAASVATIRDSAGTGLQAASVRLNQEEPHVLNAFAGQVVGSSTAMYPGYTLGADDKVTGSRLATRSFSIPSDPTTLPFYGVAGYTTVNLGSFTISTSTLPSGSDLDLDLGKSGLALIRTGTLSDSVWAGSGSTFRAIGYNKSGNTIKNFRMHNFSSSTFNANWAHTGKSAYRLFLGGCVFTPAATQYDVSWEHENSVARYGRRPFPIETEYVYSSSVGSAAEAEAAFTTWASGVAVYTAEPDDLYEILLLPVTATEEAAALAIEPMDKITLQLTDAGVSYTGAAYVEGVRYAMVGTRQAAITLYVSTP